MNDDDKDYFGNYTLGEGTLKKLQEIENLLKTPSAAQTDWEFLRPRKEKKDDGQDVEAPEPNHFPSDVHCDGEAAGAVAPTQVFASQPETMDLRKKNNEESSKNDWLSDAEVLLEFLETTNDAVPSTYLMEFLENDADDLIKCLGDRLSLKGLYNWITVICTLNIDQSMKYIGPTCKSILLPKIIELEQPLRQMSVMIRLLVEKFPEHVQEFIYVPILNADIRDTSVFSTIIKNYPPQQKNELIENFVNDVRMLKDWHIGVLSELIDAKIADNATRDKLLDLLVAKASVYCDDTNFSKFVHSFMKLNVSFTASQRNKLDEIVQVNSTVFKRVLETLLNNMYAYGDLWHIS